MYLVTFPNNPYVGQIFYHAQSKRTYEFCETTRSDLETGMVTEASQIMMKWLVFPFGVAFGVTQAKLHQ